MLQALATVGGLVAFRGQIGPPVPGRLSARHAVLLANAVLLIRLAGIMLTGTVFPLLSQAVLGERSAVGAGYFDRTAVPLALVVLLLMGVAPLFARETHPRLGPWIAVPVAAAVLTVVVTVVLSRPDAAALVGFGAASFVLAGIVQEWVRRGGQQPRTGLLAHAEVAIAALKITASSAYTRSRRSKWRSAIRSRPGASPRGWKEAIVWTAIR